MKVLILAAYRAQALLARARLPETHRFRKSRMQNLKPHVHVFRLYGSSNDRRPGVFHEEAHRDSIRAPTEIAKPLMATTRARSELATKSKKLHNPAKNAISQVRRHRKHRGREEFASPTARKAIGPADDPRARQEGGCANRKRQAAASTLSKSSARSEASSSTKPMASWAKPW